MTLRFSDADRTLDLSVRDLVQAAPPSGHLALDVAQSTLARLAAGRRAHVAWQDEEAKADDRFRAEVALRLELEIDGWTVRLHGRVDGLRDEDGHSVVEEVKTTALDAARLFRTELHHWTAWTEQLQVYVWMLHRNGRPSPEGRLVLLSLLDGARHVLGLRLDADGTQALVTSRLAALVRDRERRLAALARRRTWTVPWPHPSWRAGQSTLTAAVRSALDRGARLLIQAPTGLGKTAAVLDGALNHALATDRRLFWATTRNTQQPGVQAALDRLRAAGLPLTHVTLRAREKVCLNGVVACRPDTCAHARDYYDRRETSGVLDELLADGAITSERLMDAGRQHTLCPAQLAVDLASHADVVIGDLNYACMPDAVPPSLTSDGPEELVIIADEAHQLVDRARDHLGPVVRASAAHHALAWLAALDPDASAPFAELAHDTLRAVLAAAAAPAGPVQHGEAEANLLLEPWRRLAARVDELAFDYALLKSRTAQPDALGAPDPWLDLARAVLRLASVAEAADEGIRALVRVVRGEEHLRLLCVDPSPRLGPHLAQWGGFLGLSATLSPHTFHRDLLGLPESTERVDVPSPFDPARRRVLVVPTVSTRYKHREAQAGAIAALVRELLDAVPGHAVLFTSSFEVLRDLSARLPPGRHTMLPQRPDLSEPERRALLDRLSDPGPPLCLGAVLGGVFAEGIDPPPGALDAVIIVGPGLPPVGLERDLLRDAYEARFGKGFLYAWVVPGMTRVVQALGRLVRRPEDRGAVVLIDDRFARRPYTDLLPPDLHAEVVDDPAAALAAFFAAAPTNPERPDTAA